MEDSDTYFSSLGEILERQADELAGRIAGPPRTGETNLERLTRLREAKITASWEVMSWVAAPEEEPPAPARPRLGRP